MKYFIAALFLSVISGEDIVRRHRHYPGVRFIEELQFDNNVDPENDWKVPDRFKTDPVDIFMRSMYRKYASEEKVYNKKTDKMEPTGRLVITKASAYACAQEVLGTHKGLKGKELQDYLDTYFERSWRHFDVNLEGAIEVTLMPMFARFICSDNTIAIFHQHDRSSTPSRIRF